MPAMNLWELTKQSPRAPTLRDAILANVRVPATAPQMPLRVFGQTARHVNSWPSLPHELMCCCSMTLNLASCLLSMSSVLKMEALRNSETSVYFCQTTHHISDDTTPHAHADGPDRISRFKDEDRSETSAMASCLVNTVYHCLTVTLPQRYGQAQFTHEPPAYTLKHNYSGVKGLRKITKIHVLTV
jgi:hypothetical protein